MAGRCRGLGAKSRAQRPRKKPKENPSAFLYTFVRCYLRSIRRLLADTPPAGEANAN